MPENRYGPLWTVVAPPRGEPAEAGRACERLRPAARANKKNVMENRGMLENRCGPLWKTVGCLKTVMENRGKTVGCLKPLWTVMENRGMQEHRYGPVWTIMG